MVKTSDIIPSMVEEVEIENNENHEACAKCGGRCCMRHGCDVYPQDVKRWFKADTITKEMIIKLLDSGKVALDYWEGDVRDDFAYPDDAFSEYYPKCYFLRMRHVQESAVTASWGGTCRCFEPGKGCTLTWEQRPTGGRALIPHPDGNPNECSVLIVEKAHCALAWLTYMDIMEDIFYNYQASEDEPSDVEYMLKRLHIE